MIVLLLCGGKGSRLRPLTNELAKPLVEIKGRPILGYLMAYFQRYGLKKFVVAVGYKAEKMTAYFDKHHKEVEVQIVDSGDVDILQRVKDATQYITGDFILCYGDTLANVNLGQLAKFAHKHPKGLSVTAYPLQSQFGLLETDEHGKVTSFKEKPTLDKWINIGYFYFPHSLVPALEKHDNFVDFIQAQVDSGNLYCHKHEGVHITVNTLTELQDAEKNIDFFERSLEK